MVSKESLEKLFVAAGARRPAEWAAASAINPIQLLRFLFLKGAWKFVVPEGADWIEERRAIVRKPSEPLSGVAPALDRILSKGVSVEDLTEVVRALQYEVLFGISYLLDNPTPATVGIASELEAVGSNVRWGLFELDGSLRPTRQIAALHESALDTDPTGREMRPGK